MEAITKQLRFEATPLSGDTMKLQNTIFNTVIRIRNLKAKTETLYSDTRNTISEANRTNLTTGEVTPKDEVKSSTSTLPLR